MGGGVKHVIAGHSASKTRVIAPMPGKPSNLRKTFVQKRWMRGSSPRMTAWESLSFSPAYKQAKQLARRLTHRSSQTSSKRQPLYELFVMMVTPFTCGDQQLARRECKMIGRATSSCSFLSISQTSRLRFSRSVSADC